MCDYSLQNVKSRPAAVGDKLVTHNFATGTRGFAAPESLEGGLPSAGNRDRFSQWTSHHTRQLLRVAEAPEVHDSDFPTNQQAIP